MEQRQLAGLISRRSPVRVRPPQRLEEGAIPRHARTTARERIERGLSVITGGSSGSLSDNPPDPPRGLLASTRASWFDYWRSPLATIVQEVHLPQLSRLWQLRDERERAYRVLRRERIVKGSMGQPRRSPLYDVIGSLDSAIYQLEREYGLGPKAWVGLGLTLGEAARSLSDLNDDLERDEDGTDSDDGPDPRLLAMDGRAGRVPAAAMGKPATAPG